MASNEVRADHLFHSMKMSQILAKGSDPKEIKKIQEIIILYNKALTNCSILIETDIISEKEAFSISARLEKKIFRAGEILRILKSKEDKWKFKNKWEREEEKIKHEDALLKEDASFADDNDEDFVRYEIKHALRAINKIVDHLDYPALLKMQKKIDNLD